MTQERYTLIVRMWQVKPDRLFSADEDVNPSTQSKLIPAQPHWRGSLQLAGAPEIRYFDSLEQLIAIVEQLVITQERRT